MFDIGGMELALVGIMVLVVLGPKELPRVLHFVRSMMGQYQSAVKQVKDGVASIERELELEEVAKVRAEVANQIAKARLDSSKKTET